MACPTCGGSSRQALAPGLFRCDSIVTVTTAGPGQVDPRLGPPIINSSYVCGAEYQEGTPGSTLVCACGTFAIGRCSDCSKPVCGTHSGLYEGRRRLCSSCWRAADEAKAAAEAQAAEAAARAREEAREKALEQWRTRVLRTLEGAEPTERKVRVVAGLSRAPRGGEQAVTDWGEVRRLAGSSTWTPPSISEWFLSRATGIDPASIPAPYKGLFGAEKTRPVPAWTFRQASTTTLQHPNSAPQCCDLAMTPDGLIYVSGLYGTWIPMQPPLWASGRINFSGWGLRQVALTLRLTPVEAPPVTAR